MNNSLSDELIQEIAEQQINRFVGRFEPSYEYLAAHCALPLVLTPELVNYIRVQFLLNEEVPWIAEADLLLSDLCRPVGYELYAMTPVVRSNLLAKFTQEPFQDKFGRNRLKSIAQLLLDYVTYLMRTHPHKPDQLQAQQWAAMVYLDEQRTQAEEEIRNALQALVEGGKNGQAELARLQRLITEFQPQLSQYDSLRELAEEVGRLLKGEIPPPRPMVFEYQTPTVNRRGEIINTETKTAQYFTENLPNNVTLEMVSIPGGKFLMGSPKNEDQSSNTERPQHEVTVPPFFMGKYPITQAQWKAVAALAKVNKDLDANPSKFKGEQRPVQRVSWYDAVEFCQRLTAHTKRQYRLPSEAEWEYACRAGTTTPFHFGETITSELANYDATSIYGRGVKGTYREETTPVGSFNAANNFGLYDMHGNVDEWCLDDWHDNYEGAPIDGSAWFNDNDNLSQKHGQAVLRGGSWFDLPDYCRSASRDTNHWAGRDNIDDSLGFRVVCAVGRILQ
ncbi:MULTISPECIES: formylglycine-generating enzyme family protein [Cyanophyceae]|uniref:formylglycine-generating enzyme family protein n=1 Tax=Cyanophyceae TaxID=3028117 RepID=UPI00232AFC6D|nr:MULTISPECIES: formylglycine-generating enzyme family protein [Cyanophyceae]MDB9358062.1 formylglycine-generating enzyme family protein [Nodularia spumigena CS-587/03]MDB9339970.1 formylglycine-generating enzyme family protein [Nodularia spumigena CS-589/07]MDB9399506.1 formylglycine-generating enzyme family protein [Microcystis aeruginosa CS-567/02-A1]MDB9498154.1 formylglycine-generating enzyme family protein [Nodularia spumigena CS-336/02]MDB9531648.1 formylglycine-generating enzyme famil